MNKKKSTGSKLVGRKSVAGIDISPLNDPKRDSDPDDPLAREINNMVADD